LALPKDKTLRGQDWISSPRLTRSMGVEARSPSHRTDAKGRKSF